MVSRFEAKFNNFLRSLKGLEENLYKTDTNAQKALLYDFSGAIEQGWKLIKYYLERVNGADNLGNQSKKILRAGKDDGLYDEEDLDKFMDMVDLRNTLMHEYDYDAIEDSCNKIKEYYEALNKLYAIFSEMKAAYARYWQKDMIDI